MAETVDGGQSRIEQQRLQPGAMLVGYRDWPGVVQVFQLERQVIRKKTGEVREAREAGGTGLPSERADAAR